MEQIKYRSISRMGHRSTVGMFEVGDEIVITEKIDASNASFTLDNGVVKVFSRNLELDETNNLNGFYQWVQENINPKELVKEFIYFGEWLGNPHKVRYEGHEKSFFLFDVYDKQLEKYIPFHHVVWEAKRMKLNRVPVLYDGSFISFEHLESHVGKTELGGMIGTQSTGEGIVVKNYSKQGFAKMVTEAFREVHRGAKEYKKPVELGAEALFARETVTPARIEKMMFKLKDEQVLAPDLEIEDMGNILKVIIPALIEDIVKEEGDQLPEGYDSKILSKAVSRVVPPVVRVMLTERVAV